MSGTLLCVGAFLICFVAGRRSVAWGIAALLLVGYSYGILRANYYEPASHFIFDSGAVGLYAGIWTLSFDPGQRHRVNILWKWVMALGVWPLMLFCVPVQDPLIQLVGLRVAIFFLPAILVGALITDDELYTLSLCISMLNLIAFVFAMAEYSRGLTAFYPHNAVTHIIYIENDVVARARDIYRLPATFPTPAGYGGVMVLTLPILIGAWVQAERDVRQRYLLLAGIFVSIVGVFLSASRTQALFLLLILVVSTFSGQLPVKKYIAWLLLVGVVVWIVSGSSRMQRFTELKDASMVQERVHGSVNMHFFDMAELYPLGNGLGAGGTSLPYFLRERVKDPVAMENEYARIMLEEGIPGLLIWLAFIGWVLLRGYGPTGDTWFLTRRLTWFLLLAQFLAAGTGSGTLTAIPNTFLLLFFTGWYVATPRPLRSEARARQHAVA